MSKTETVPVLRENGELDKNIDGLWGIWCSDTSCGLNTQGWTTPEYAITAWNTRAESPLADSHARLVKALERLIDCAASSVEGVRIGGVEIARAAIEDAKKVQP